MEGGPSKINLPNSHPSNPIHKAARAAQTASPASKTQTQRPASNLPSDKTGEIEETFSEKKTRLELSKTTVIVGVVALVASLFIASLETISSD